MELDMTYPHRRRRQCPKAPRNAGSKPLERGLVRAIGTRRASTAPKAIRKILAGGQYVSPALAEKLALGVRTDLTRTPHETLSDREYEVMSRIGVGKTVTEIADELTLSAKTISTYRARVLEKLSVKNSAEIVQYAIRNGLVM
jgi:DNA-binding NarL/FixJ family response regulator